MKWCRNCKWRDFADQCNHPEVMELSYITGRKVPRCSDCELVRKYGSCGHEGKYFELKIPFYKRLIDLFKRGFCHD